MRQQAVLAIVFLGTFCPICHGWGPEGHLIIARIAESHLTPRTNAAVADLLDQRSLCDVATWADRVRKQPEYLWSDSLHGATIAGNGTTFDLKRDCPKGCVVSAVFMFTETLEKKDASRKERTDALKFLVHFVSDLHEPVHVTSARRNREARSNLTFFGQPAKFHGIWDGLMIQHTGKPWESYAEELGKQIKPDQFAKWSAVTDPVAWANESHDAIERYAYDLPADGKVGQAYCDRCLPVLNARLSMGGVHLATRLNAIFDPKPTTQTAPAGQAATCTYDRGGIIRGPRDRKRIALIFTGGKYGEGCTNILDALNARHVKGSFFVTGDFLRTPEHEAYLRRMVSEGHYVGPHSDAHLLYCPWEDRSRTLVTEAAFRADLEKNLADLSRYGRAPEQMRFFIPPYEWYNEQIAAWTRRMGLTLFNFTPGTRSNADYLADNDPRFLPSQRILDSILACESGQPDGLNGFLLLLHLGAGPERTDKMYLHVGPLIDELTRRGYTFVRVDEMLGNPASKSAG
jgi:peptidoglycan/xylan/chitin deacetylase (PgdA/CDA1 family)